MVEQIEISKLKSKMGVKISWGFLKFLLYLLFWPCSCLRLLLFLLCTLKLVKDCLDASLPSLRLTSVSSVW